MSAIATEQVCLSATVALLALGLPAAGILSLRTRASLSKRFEATSDCDRQH